MKKNTNNHEIEKKAAEEHLMEKFPEPQVMPTQWHQTEPIRAQSAQGEQKDKIEASAENNIAPSDHAEQKVEKEHAMEKFPKPRTMPEEWHFDDFDK